MKGSFWIQESGGQETHVRAGVGKGQGGRSPIGVRRWFVWMCLLGGSGIAGACADDPEIHVLCCCDTVAEGSGDGAAIGEVGSIDGDAGESDDSDESVFGDKDAVPKDIGAVNNDNDVVPDVTMDGDGGAGDDIVDASGTTDAVPELDIAETVDASDMEDVDDSGSPSPDTKSGPPTGEMVCISGGMFWMGCNAAKQFESEVCSDNEKPQHQVTLKPYCIDTTEVTVSAYRACVDARLCSPPNIVHSEDNPLCNYDAAGKDDHPANCVTWCEARAYCEAVGKDLPSEAQWEMAARGSCADTLGQVCKQSMRTYPWGDEPPTCDLAVFWENESDLSGSGCGNEGTMPVGSMANGDSFYGIKDMSGNVYEWTNDCDQAYPEFAVDDPSYADCTPPGADCNGGGQRMVRSSSFFDQSDSYLRPAFRSARDPNHAEVFVGFRCAK